MRLLLAILLFSSLVVSAQTNRPLAAVNTVADLIARKPVTNERLLVSGWRTPGDWGAQRVVRHDPASVLATNNVLHDGIFPAAPTNNGAYVLYVTNGVASWIAHP